MFRLIWLDWQPFKNLKNYYEILTQKYGKAGVFHSNINLVSCMYAMFRYKSKYKKVGVLPIYG